MAALLRSKTLITLVHRLRVMRPTYAGIALDLFNVDIRL